MIDETTLKVDSNSLVSDLGSQRRLSDEIILKMNLKTQLKIYFEEKNISASQLAKLSGVSKQVLSLWMSGASPKKLDRLSVWPIVLVLQLIICVLVKELKSHFKTAVRLNHFQMMNG